MNQEGLLVPRSNCRLTSLLVRFVALDEPEARDRLRQSIHGLAKRKPHLSAIRLLTQAQRWGFIALALLLLVGTILSSHAVGILVVSVATTFYVAVIINRLVLFKGSLRAENVETVSDEEARAVADKDLPIYTVLLPAYKEPEVIHLLLANLGQLDYPTDRLDIKVLLEADDDETIDAVRGLDVGDHIEVVLVPPSQPRTKPKALNYGLSLARGELVTIYDAEDKPDPLQLRRAAVALGRLGPEVACLQAKLSYDNVDQNLITKWFTIEYAMWFSLFLPGLVRLGAPLPLGGTSNHFRRKCLERLGAWDPHNVTEDADLGIRLYRRGYTAKVLESVTYEEANSDFVNWVKQRSRWYKGYLQTWLIHMRRPRQLMSEIGPMGVIQFTLFVGATPILALLNSVFWIMTVVWFVGHPHFIKAIFPAPVFYLAILCWTFGNFAIFYLTLVSCRIDKRFHLLWAALLVPVYWVMMTIAAVKAIVQLVYTPSFWEKTVHGLNLARTGAPAGRQVEASA